MGVSNLKFECKCFYSRDLVSIGRSEWDFQVHAICLNCKPSLKLSLAKLLYILICGGKNGVQRMLKILDSQFWCHFIKYFLLFWSLMWQPYTWVVFHMVWKGYNQVLVCVCTYKFWVLSQITVSKKAYFFTSFINMFSGSPATGKVLLYGKKTPKSLSVLQTIVKPHQSFVRASVLSIATTLYISLSGSFQKAAVHDGYAISRLS